MNNLGRVAMVHRGDYSPTYDYKPLDCCYHDGSTYFCKAATTGNAPPNTTYWVLMSTSASTVDRDAVYNAIATHDHSGSTGMGVPIGYEHLVGNPPCPYDVGDILTTINPASPAMRWPGTVWAGVESGRFLVAAGEGYAANSAGGSPSAILTANNLPPLSMEVVVQGAGSNLWGLPAPTSSGNAGSVTGYVSGGGTSEPVDILPPYLAVYMWQRTA